MQRSDAAGKSYLFVRNVMFVFSLISSFIFLSMALRAVYRNRQLSSTTYMENASSYIVGYSLSLTESSSNGPATTSTNNFSNAS